MIILIGKKIGMTRIFLNNGLSIPVTVIKIEKNVITCIKKNNSKYFTQITVFCKKIKKINKPKLGYFNKLNIKPGIGLWEIPYLKNIHLNVGQYLNINLFKNVNRVDITGISKGKGFCGTIKRWNFSSQDSTHGNSLSHRVPGSIGQNQTPGKVFKGKKMSGHLGNSKVTIHGLKIIKLYKKNNLMLIKGCVPGFNGNILKIKSSIKNNLK